MRKLSGLFSALLIVAAVAIMVVSAGCKQDSASPVTNNDLYPSGAKSTPLPDSAKVKVDTTAQTSAATTPTPPPPAPPKEIKPVQKTGKYSAPTAAEVAAAKAAGTRQAIIKTDKGTMTAELDGANAPLTVANFVKLANAHFYDGLTFHRVEPGFCIQGGDPDGNGTGGPGYSIKLEISKKLRHIDGALAMARSGDPDSAGSQFYITLGAQPSLDDQYAVFGKVIKNLEVSKNIAIGDKIISITIK